MNVYRVLILRLVFVFVSSVFVVSIRHYSIFLRWFLYSERRIKIILFELDMKFSIRIRLCLSNINFIITFAKRSAKSGDKQSKQVNEQKKLHKFLKFNHKMRSIFILTRISFAHSFDAERQTKGKKNF